MGDGAVRVRMDVDEPRSEREPVRVQDFVAPPAPGFGDLEHAAAPDDNVGGSRRAARAVVDRGALNTEGVRCGHLEDHGISGRIRNGKRV